MFSVSWSFVGLLIICLCHEIPCLNNEFRCSDGKCIPMRWRCDGIDDCDDSGDERGYCPECHEGDHRCGSGNCLASSLVCDGEPDCIDWSDEKGCATTLQCLENEFECSDGRLCISMRYRCNVHRDCFDGSDESGCEDHRCTERHYQCPEGKCVPELWVCDGFGMLDCRNGSDEKDCIPCLNNEFRCSDGKYIPMRWRCNGVDDCDDSGDERDCPECHEDDYRCRSGNCLADSLVCDGVPDCHDWSDEKGCGECKNWGCSQFCNQTKPRPQCYCAEGFVLYAKDKRSCIRAEYLSLFGQEVVTTENVIENTVSPTTPVHSVISIYTTIPSTTRIPWYPPLRWPA